MSNQVEIMIDCELFKDRESVHDVLCDTLSFPNYYGKNLDALYDCLTDLQNVKVVFYHSEKLKEYLGEYGEDLLQTFLDAQQENENFTFIMS